VLKRDGKVEKYEIKIVKITDIAGANSKGMVIEVTDKKLLEKTGGIIQGMSGSPIVQNGKFIGAVTHVYVNDPTRGYAIFGDTMIEQINKI
jgi:stage IV sporulation protein B